MALYIHKYGGSSVADAAKIVSVARRLAAVHDAGHRVVAVVSAMGDTTDELIELAHTVAGEPDPRELDLLLSTGELVSITLLSMALRSLGYDAISLSGPQAGIRTDRAYGRARISQVAPARIRRELAQGRLVIVAGFQGLTPDEDITTLGRGGSDTTAVALAAALDADRCDIYTDVQGIYTADPRAVPKPAAWPPSATRKCWNWPPPAPKCTPVPLNWAPSIMSPSMWRPALPMPPAP